MDSIAVGTHAELLADRGDRFAAALLDSFVLGAAMLLPTLAINATALGTDLPNRAIAYVGWTVFQLVQAYLLTTRGQTIGKLAFRIRIVRSTDGGSPGFVRAVVLRLVVPELVFSALTWQSSMGDGIRSFGWISLETWPSVLAVLLQFADVLFIFSADRRCLHDRLAGTKVIRVLAPRAQSS